MAQKPGRTGNLTRGVSPFDYVIYALLHWNCHHLPPSGKFFDRVSWRAETCGRRF